jgi:hypothetical protein
MRFEKGDMVLCIKEDFFKNVIVGSVYEIDDVISFNIIDYPNHVRLKNISTSCPESNFIKSSSLVKELF